MESPGTIKRTKDYIKITYSNRLLGTVEMRISTTIYKYPSDIKGPYYYKDNLWSSDETTLTRDEDDYEEDDINICQVFEYYDIDITDIVRKCPISTRLVVNNVTYDPVVLYVKDHILHTPEVLFVPFSENLSQVVEWDVPPNIIWKHL